MQRLWWYLLPLLVALHSQVDVENIRQSAAADVQFRRILHAGEGGAAGSVIAANVNLLNSGGTQPAKNGGGANDALATINAEVDVLDGVLGGDRGGRPGDSCKCYCCGYFGRRGGGGLLNIDARISILGNQRGGSNRLTCFCLDSLFPGGGGGGSSGERGGLLSLYLALTLLGGGGGGGGERGIKFFWCDPSKGGPGKIDCTGNALIDIGLFLGGGRSGLVNVGANVGVGGSGGVGGVGGGCKHAHGTVGGLGGVSSLGAVKGDLLGPGTGVGVGDLALKAAAGYGAGFGGVGIPGGGIHLSHHGGVGIPGGGIHPLHYGGVDIPGGGIHPSHHGGVGIPGGGIHPPHHGGIHPPHHGGCECNTCKHHGPYGDYYGFPGYGNCYGDDVDKHINLDLFQPDDPFDYVVNHVINIFTYPSKGHKKVKVIKHVRCKAGSDCSKHRLYYPRDSYIDDGLHPELYDTQHAKY